MLEDRKYLRIADGKIALTARLSRRLVARVDLAVAHRHLADDWVTRVAVVEECLERFFTAGGMVRTETRPERSLVDRKGFRLHLDRETVQLIYAELTIPELKRERLVPWEVIATALLDHIDAVDMGPPPDLTAITS